MITFMLGLQEVSLFIALSIVTYSAWILQLPRFYAGTSHIGLRLTSIFSAIFGFIIFSQCLAIGTLDSITDLLIPGILLTLVIGVLSTMSMLPGNDFEDATGPLCDLAVRMEARLSHTTIRTTRSQLRKLYAGNRLLFFSRVLPVGEALTIASFLLGAVLGLLDLLDMLEVTTLGLALILYGRAKFARFLSESGLQRIVHGTIQTRKFEFGLISLLALAFPAAIFSFSVPKAMTALQPLFDPSVEIVSPLPLNPIEALLLTVSIALQNLYFLAFTSNLFIKVTKRWRKEEIITEFFGGWPVYVAIAIAGIFLHILLGYIPKAFFLFGWYTIGIVSLEVIILNFTYKPTSQSFTMKVSTRTGVYVLIGNVAGSRIMLAGTWKTSLAISLFLLDALLMVVFSELSIQHKHYLMKKGVLLTGLAFITVLAFAILELKIFNIVVFFSFLTLMNYITLYSERMTMLRKKHISRGNAL